MNSTMLDSGIDVRPLPQNASCVELHCLDGGSFIADNSIVHAGGTGRYRMYTWAFYIKDLGTGQRVLWDVGIGQVRVPNIILKSATKRNQNCNIYPPAVQKLVAAVDAVGPRKSLAEQLLMRGVKASEIDSVLFRYRLAPAR